MKMRKILMKRAAELKAKMRGLEERANAEDVTTQELEEINEEVQELTADLTETNQALEDLPTEDNDEPVVGQEGAEAGGEAGGLESVNPEQRNQALQAIRSGLSQEPLKDKEKQKRSGFLQFLGGKINETKARSLGVDFNNGKVLVPQETVKELITYAEEQNPARKFGTIHRTKGITGFPIQVAKAAANYNKKERDDKNKLVGTDIEFDDYFLNPGEIDALIKVTEKLTYMSDFDVESIVLEELKKAYVRKEVFLHIHDTSNPGSIKNKAVPFLAKGDNTYLKLVQLKNALPTSLRSGARWFMNRAAQTEIESILDKNGNPILKESGNADFEYKLFNYPVEVSDHWDNPTTPEKPVLHFGNMSFFHIQDVIAAIKIQALFEKYSDENKIGYKIYNLTDGQLVYGPYETPFYSLDLTSKAPSGS